jgi:uncharacterized repeat protein (TIGR03803 family)
MNLNDRRKYQKDSCAVGGFMNYARQQDKPFRMMAVFVAVMVGLAVAGEAVPAQAQTPAIVYALPGGTGEPNSPDCCAIAQGRDGNLYVTTQWGGNVGPGGTVFNVTPSGTATEVESSIPWPFGVTLGTDGNFYGATIFGGTSGLGTVYKLTPKGVLTLLHSFTNTGDGDRPQAPPIEGTNGIFYGITTSASVPDSTAYSVNPNGVFKTIHTFTGPDGQDLLALVQGTDGNLYASTGAGGTSNDGVIFKMTPVGMVTVLHNFTGTDGSGGGYALIQARDGNFYGVAGGGTNGAGVIFKITPGGTYTVIHNLNGTTDGSFPNSSLVQATDGNLYGVTSNQNALDIGTVFKVTTSGTFTTLYTFTSGYTFNPDGGYPQSPLRQHTNGLLYGSTFTGGDSNCSTSIYSGGEYHVVPGCGVIYGLDIGAKPFVSLVSSSGEVGSKVGILGQGFSKASIVKFGGVQVTSFTLTGTTFIVATVPAGAIDGKVTVATGSTQLTSWQTFIVHNSWSSGAVLPTGLQGPATGVIRGKVYVVGGATNSGSVAITQIYNPATNKWTAGASMPTARFSTASGVVDNILYVIGGSTDGVTPLSVVEAYDPSSNTWSTKGSLPTATASPSAAVEHGIIYVVGGYSNGARTAAVESYNPVTDVWTAEAPLAVAKSLPAVGLLGSTIVAAGGLANSGETGDNEGYSATKNSWSALTADPTARSASCVASIAGRLIVGGGANGTPLKVVESFSATADKWTTLLPLPQAVVAPGGAEVNGLLYCFGGSNNGVIGEGTVYNYLQIYQP